MPPCATHWYLPALLGLTLLGGALLPAMAQDQAAPPPAAQPIAPGDTAPDSGLLLKALTTISTASAVSSESDLDITAKKAGASVTFHQHLKIVAKRPGRFHSDIDLGTAGGPVTRYVVVSNGQKVTTYQPGAGQYSISSLVAFKAADNDLPALGIHVGQLYLDDFASTLVSAATATGTALDKTIKKMGMSLTGKIQEVDGASLAAFTLAIPKTGKYVFYVDPQTSTLKQVELKGSDSGAAFDMVEKITTFSPAASVSPTSFQPNIPDGTHKIKQVNIGSF